MRDGYTDELMWHSYIWQGGDGHVYLNPGGWLTAVMIRKLDSARDDLRFELTDENLVPLFTDILVECWYDRGGKWFEPVPNVNAACPYVLSIPAGAPKLEITSINRMQEW